MNFFDWFSGIGGFRLGLERAGHVCVGASEIGDFQRRVYETRFGDVPMGDMTALTPADMPRADLWVGGWPCQGVSSAGLRKGIFGDDRSNLIWPLLDLADRCEAMCACGHDDLTHIDGNDCRGDCPCGEFKSVGPTWLLLENVPGLLSGKDWECTAGGGKNYGGRPEDPCPACERPLGDAAAGHVPRPWIGELFGALADRGWRWSWRVLDAQFFGLAQHRERVFFLARRARAAGPDPADVLLDPPGVRGDPPPRRAPRQEVAGTVTAGSGSSRRSHDASGAAAGHVIPIARTIAASFDRSDDGSKNTLVCSDSGVGDHCRTPEERAAVGGQQAQIPYTIQPEFGSGVDLRADPTDISPTLSTETGRNDRGVRVAVAFDPAQVTSPDNRSRCDPDAPAPSLAAQGRPHVATYSVFSEGSCAKEHHAKETDVARTIDSRGGFASGQGGTLITGVGEDGQPSYTLRATSQRGVAHALGVRRLLPVECERLQGLPDGWTDIEGASDSKRYEALGNSVAVTVIEWIGRRLKASQ